MPRVSVATALYNHQPFLAERARSILDQSMGDFEWIIVDDCSTDDSYAEMRRLTGHDRRVSLTRNSENLGFTRTVQRCLDGAAGKYVYLADSDDSCDLRFLEVMSGLMEANPAVGFAHCRGLRMDERNGVWGGIPRRRERYLRAPEAFAELVLDYTIRQPTLLFRGDKIREVGGFARLPLKGTSDWYLVLRIALIADVIFCPLPLAYHRTHADNMSGKPAVGLENFMLLEDVFDHLPSSSRHLEGLRQPAYRAAAAQMRPSIERLRELGMAEDYRAALETMRKYVPAFETLPQRKGRHAVRSLAHAVVKLLTYRKVG